MFLCNILTEQECLDRQLFGTNPGKNLNAHYNKVVVGDQLFLYNFETGVLRGPYRALTACIHNLEPSAWKKSRRAFPWQVRVDCSDALTTLVRADDFAAFIPLTVTRVGLLPPAELSDEQTEQLLAVMRRSVQ